jgi:hypothetical protein
VLTSDRKPQPYGRPLKGWLSDCRQTRSGSAFLSAAVPWNSTKRANAARSRPIERKPVGAEEVWGVGVVLRRGDAGLRFDEIEASERGASIIRRRL